MYQEIDLGKIDLNSGPPTKEPDRQYYFMAKCREWAYAFEEKNGRPPLAFIQTFGCQMNTEHEIEKPLKRGFLFRVEI